MKASNIFNGPQKLQCAYCGENLLENELNSMVLIVKDKESQIVAIKPCCKKECDNHLRNQYLGYDTDGWRELSDFLNPHSYMKHVMAIMNNMFKRELFANEEAFEEYKDLILRCYPYVTRDLTDDEKSYVEWSDLRC